MRSGTGKLTKLVSAACVSCCSAAPRTAASVESQYQFEWACASCRSGECENVPAEKVFNKT